MKCVHQLQMTMARQSQRKWFTCSRSILRLARTTWIIAFDVIGFFSYKIHKFCNKIPKRVSAHTLTHSVNNFHWCRPLNWKIIHSCLVCPTWPGDDFLCIYCRTCNVRLRVCALATCHPGICSSPHMYVLCVLEFCFLVIFNRILNFVTATAHTLNEIECHKKYINSMAQATPWHRMRRAHSFVCFLRYCNSWFQHWPYIVPNFNRIESAILFCGCWHHIAWRHLHALPVKIVRIGNSFVELSTCWYKSKKPERFERELDAMQWSPNHIKIVQTE